ncbi:MAG: hypothetical protein U1F42_11440 [Candidatus Competibacteraceae bacterium]
MTDNPLAVLSEYDLRHLTAHLAIAGRFVELHRLLALETHTRRNAWYETHDNAGDVRDFLQDIDRAWHLAEQAFLIEQSPVYLGLQCRYALITASINSITDRVTAAHMVALVENEVWPTRHVLAYAHQAPHEEQRLEVLTAIVPYLSNQELQQALATTRSLSDPKNRAQGLVTLARYVAEPLHNQFLQEALDAVRTVQSSGDRALILEWLAKFFPPPIRAEVSLEALAAARATEDTEERMKVLRWVGPSLPNPLRQEVLREALQLIWASKLFYDHKKYIIELAPYLSESLLQETVATLREPHRSEVYRAPILVGLAPHVPKDMLQSLLRMAREFQYNGARAEALQGLAPFLPQTLSKEVLNEALTAAQAIKDKEIRQWSLRPIVRQYARLGFPEEALAIALSIRRRRYRAEALKALIPDLPDSLQAEGIRQALKAANSPWPWHREARAENLADLAPFLPLPWLRRAVAAVRSIRSEDERAMALSQLLPRVADEGEAEEAVAAARGIKSGYYRATVLERLIPHLTEPLGYEAMQHAVAAAMMIKDEDERAGVLLDLAIKLPDATRNETLRQSLYIRQGIRDSDHQARALTRLSPRQHRRLLRQVLTSIRASRKKMNLQRSTTTHSPDWKRHLLQQAIIATLNHRMQGVLNASQVMALLAPHLPGPLLESTLEQIFAIPGKFRRESLLRSLIPHLSEPLLREVMARLDGIQEYEDDTQKLWAKVASRLACFGYCDEALGITRTIPNASIRSNVFAEIASFLTSLPKAILMQLWLEQRSGANLLHVLATRGRNDLLQDIRALTPIMIALGGIGSEREISKSIDDACRWWP